MNILEYDLPFDFEEIKIISDQDLDTEEITYG